MSMNHEIRIRALEKQVEELLAAKPRFDRTTTERVHMIVGPNDETLSFDVWDGAEFYAKRGFQGFYVYNGETKVSDQPLKKDEAWKLAEELNEAAA